MLTLKLDAESKTLLPVISMTVVANIVIKHTLVTSSLHSDWKTLMFHSKKKYSHFITAVDSNLARN
jgi:hypothetical protein